MNGFDNNISAEGVKLISEFRFLLNFEQYHRQTESK